MCEFARYLYQSGWSGQYVPVDGAIDGHDLNDWPGLELPAPYVVAIEVAEHMEKPHRFLRALEKSTSVGAVLTTPNPHTVDVLSMDATHRSLIFPEILEGRGWSVEFHDLFSKDEQDTIVATWRRN